MNNQQNTKTSTDNNNLIFYNCQLSILKSKQIINKLLNKQEETEVKNTKNINLYKNTNKNVFNNKLANKITNSKIVASIENKKDLADIKNKTINKKVKKLFNPMDDYLNRRKRK